MRETTHTLQFNYDIVGRPLANPTRDIWISMQPAEILIPLVLGLASLTIIPIAYRLHKDYAWAIYKSIYGSADLRLRFVFFFLVRLAIQYNLIDVHFQELEYSLTTAIIPATILIMFFGIYCVKSELRLGMGIVIVSLLGLMAYLLSRIIILCGNTQRANTPGKEMMLLFAVVTLAFIVTALVTGTIRVHVFSYIIRTEPYGKVEAKADSFDLDTKPTIFKDNMTSEFKRLQRNRWEIINIWRPLKQVPRDHLSVSDSLSFPGENLIEICGRVPGMEEEGDGGSTNGAGFGVLYATYSTG
ncbi:hypothetical protein ETB97_002017 [Aspergillus alliaceus]|uniref:Uncharacterized protein n=1 Tax=Petromyces alliaceus TaxID=209559 RepID=A0A8H6A3V6_PETAA|nr:hypothetical protein ETB97_002017 [Aspergillus burnettii]